MSEISTLVRLDAPLGGAHLATFGFEERTSIVTARALSGAWPSPAPITLDLRVEGPDTRGLSDVDARRLFPNRTSGERLNRLRNWPRVVVRIDDVTVGVATYTRTPIEMHVPDFAVKIPASIAVNSGDLAARVLDSLLGALEVASLAGGCRRVVLIPSTNEIDLARRGYILINEGCGGSWMEKALL